jgi:hypothetical protein
MDARREIMGPAMHEFGMISIGEVFELDLIGKAAPELPSR